MRSSATANATGRYAASARDKPRWWIFRTAGGAQAHCRERQTGANWTKHGLERSNRRAGSGTPRLARSSREHWCTQAAMCGLHAPGRRFLQPGPRGTAWQIIFGLPAEACRRKTVLHQRATPRVVEVMRTRYQLFVVRARGRGHRSPRANRGGWRRRHYDARDKPSGPTAIVGAVAAAPPLESTGHFLHTSAAVMSRKLPFIPSQ